MIYQWLKNSLPLNASRQCLLCLAPSKSRRLLCKGCESDLPKNVDHCIICAIPINTNNNKLVCGGCQKHSPNYDTSIIPHIYASPIKQLITQLKFHSNLSYATLLADNFVQALETRSVRLPECIIPVPLHWQRLRERGFNQALELARIVSAKLDIPVDYSLCTRNKDTPYQSGLSARQRKQNLKKAFRVGKQNNYKHVAIFDDVVTTGTTVNELAKQLKLNGIEVVEVWAIARTCDKNH